MTFQLDIDTGLSKEEKYKVLIPQINTLIADEENSLCNLANITSALKYTFEKFLWVGIYFANDKKTDELVLGPFQGRIACGRIPFGRGVCGAAALKKETIVVPDVDKFPGHIVCDTMSKSEIAIPVIIDDKTAGVLDIDSDEVNNFDDIDKSYLEKIIKNISHLFVK